MSYLDNQIPTIDLKLMSYYEAVISMIVNLPYVPNMAMGRTATPEFYLRCLASDSPKHT